MAGSLGVEAYPWCIPDSFGKIATGTSGSTKGYGGYTGGGVYITFGNHYSSIIHLFDGFVKHNRT